MKRYKHKKYNKQIAYKIKIYIIGVIVIILGFYFFVDKENIEDIKTENIASLKISSDVINKIKSFSTKYEMDFSELLTYYSLENHFFENKIETDDKIEQNFIMNYDKIKAKYNYDEIRKYYDLFNSIINEIKCFPINSKYFNDYIYSDSWGGSRTYGGDRIHEGCDIMDKENIRGRIPIVSMTDGKIQNANWNELGGYNVGIVSESGNYYYYAHLNSFESNISEGENIKSGDIIGYMGDSGYGTEGTTGQFPVHLHIGIYPKIDFGKENFAINPYPFLSMVEKTNSKK